MEQPIQEQTLERLICENEQTTLRLCCALLGDVDLAQDAVQETFLRVYCHFNRFRGECSEKTWITRIAVNVCREFQRQRWFRMIDHSISLDMLPEPVAPCTQEETDLMMDILNLPARYREVLLLRCWQGMSVEETATALHIGKRTVSNRMKKARKLLNMEEEGGENHE